MADTTTIARVRTMVGPGVLTDSEIGEIIDSQPTGEAVDLTLAIAEVWEAQAARYSTLVNVSESGSSRSMGDMHKNALAMAATYRKQLDEAAAVIEPSTSRSGTRRITRI